MNNKQRQRIQIFLLAFLAVIALFSSCADYNKVLYLRDIPDSVRTKTSQLAKYHDPVIQSDDILSIIILTIDPSTATVVNQGQIAPQGSLTGVLGSQPISGYLVDKNGTVSLPIIGTVKLAGLTTSEATDLIREKTAQFYKDPNIQVRFANFKVTVLGEVNRPSTYILPSEKNTILDALGLAGDITIYGKKDNVLLIRDSLDKKIYVRLNLNSSKALQSPYFYLKQNDVIYVEPTKDKLVASDATQTKFFTIAVSVITAAALILIRFK